MERQRIKRTWGVAIAGVCLLIPGILLAVCMGAMEILPVDIWNGIFHNTGSLTDMMIRDVRLPRVICVLVTGGILGMTGAMMQGVTRNPIAEPSLLGISQGATLFVALLYASGIGATAGNTLLAALLGAFFSGVPVLIFTMKNPGNLSITKLLLAGTAMSTFFTALTSVAGLLSNQSQMVGFWVSGGFRGATWLDVKIILAAGIPGFLAAVVVGKTIGFVGLMIPQTIRLFAGTDYRRVIPLSFLCGAVLLTYADIAARMIYQPYEVPIGIFTAMLGVPFFLYMAGKERG